MTAAGIIAGPASCLRDGSQGRLEVVRDLGGRATFTQITDATTRWALRTAVAEGRVVRVGRGVYALPKMPEPLVTAAALRGVVSHLSAAQLWGLARVHDPAVLHVTVPHGHRRRRRRHVVVHRSRYLDPEDLERGLTSAVRTVLDCAATLPFVQALAVADSALALGMVSKDALEAAATAAQGAGRSARLLVARAADGRSANAFESALRGILVEAGMVDFTPQVEIQLPGRRVRVDLADRARKLVVEADSFEFHGDRDGFERDCERYDALTAAGWVVLRFTWRQVVDHPQWVVETVRATSALRR